MKDIETRVNIEFLINAFYQKITIDKLVGHFFTEVVVLEWDKHIPIIVDFWEGVLFGATKYKGNPMLKHIELSKKSPLKALHFERWLSTWEETIRAHFEGPKAEEAISRARQIGSLMQFKIEKSS
ncbi:MAG: hemoglobin [Sphingobacteriales bacterium]|jgi:hemoglobin